MLYSLQERFDKLKEELKPICFEELEEVIAHFEKLERLLENQKKSPSKNIT